MRAGRVAVGDDAGADITSRPRDPVHRHGAVRPVPQQHHADRAVAGRELPRTIRSLAGSNSSQGGALRGVFPLGAVATSALRKSAPRVRLPVRLSHVGLLFQIRALHRAAV